MEAYDAAMDNAAGLKNISNQRGNNMKHYKRLFTILLVLVFVFAMTGCGGASDQSSEGGEEQAAEETSEATSDAQGVDLKEVLKTLYTSEEELGLVDKYTSTADIPDTFVDPDIVGTWKMADGSVTYTYNEDGTAKTSMELYGDNESTFKCFKSGDYNIIAEDQEMIDYSDEEEKTVPIVAYINYKVENDVMYMTVVESPSEFANQSLTQVLSLYKADENGDITAAVNNNPVSLESFYGEWTYGDDNEHKLTIDENGLTLEGGEALPLHYNELGKLVVGDADSFTEYSVGLAYERLYDNTDGIKLTGENYALALAYTSETEEDKPNLADAMTDWHSEFGYESYYFSLNAKRPME